MKHRALKAASSVVKRFANESSVETARTITCLRGKHAFLLTALLGCALGVLPADGQMVQQPHTGELTLGVAPIVTYGKSTATLTVYDSCAAGATEITEYPAPPAAGEPFAAGQVVQIHMSAALIGGEHFCVRETYTPGAGEAAKDPTMSALVTVTNGIGAVAGHAYDGVCDYNFNDCDWTYSLVGGVEQSVLSSQNSQTEPFVDLFVRAPWNTKPLNVWLQARFLGSPTNSDTNGVVAAASNPTGTITSTSLATVGNGVDYAVGVQHDFLLPNRLNPARGMFTLGAIASFGATSPLSSQNATNAFVMPNFGTDECTQLQARFGTSSNYSSTPLPGSGSVTTTTTVGSDAPVTTMKNYCSVQMFPTTTMTSANGVNTTVATTSTPVADIAFVPQDRSSFLLKYSGGVRLINRWHAPGTTRCSSAGNDSNPTPGIPVNGLCNRSIVDFTLGQDQAITGAKFHGMVFKSDAVFPIPGGTGLYFFTTAAIRMGGNRTLPPLLLTPIPVSSGNAAAAAGGITVPSTSVFVLPLKQSDRDFYRIGIALDLSKIFTKL